MTTVAKLKVSDVDAASPMAELLRLMSAQLLSSTSRSLRNEDMSLAELATIYLLDRDGAMRINGLAASLSLSMPAASRVVSALVNRGLIDRREDTEDRRAKMIALTRRGRRLVDSLTINLVNETAGVLETADTPVGKRLAQLFGTMVAEGLTGASPKK
jgi:DNA-binding MarR family transcriptional regulator